MLDYLTHGDNRRELFLYCRLSYMTVHGILGHCMFTTFGYSSLITMKLSVVTYSVQDMLGLCVLLH